MRNVKSIGALLGAGKPEAKAESVAAQHLWLRDFEGAPEWFLKKYFRTPEGYTSGRMYVKAYADLGAVLVENGKVLTDRFGRVRKLTTGYLAKRVSEDCAKAGFPGMNVHFKGYSLDPEMYVLCGTFAQEEYEENEARHVPGLDEDDEYDPGNRTASLDRTTWESCAGFMLNALRTHTLMYWGVDDDFARVMSAPDHVHASYNLYLEGLWNRIRSMVSVETLDFLVGKDDFSMFEAEDVVRTYARAMRVMTGKEPGEPMFEDAKLLDPDAEPKELEEWYDWFSMGLGSRTVMAKFWLIEAMVLANADPTEEVAEWAYEDAPERELYDDDTGELATEALLAL